MLESKWNATTFRVVPAENSLEERSIWKKIVRFLRMAEFSKRKFVFHSISSKQPFFTRFRPSQPFFGKWFGFVHIENAIPGWNWLVLIFAYHLPKAWTDRFADVNNCQSPSRLSGWPSGLRRCVQVAVYSCRRGFESHSWQLILFSPKTWFFLLFVGLGVQDRVAENILMESVTIILNTSNRLLFQKKN